MVVITIIIVSIMLIALFVAVTIAGGRSHDRANEIATREASKLNLKVSEDQQQTDG